MMVWRMEDGGWPKWRIGWNASDQGDCRAVGGRIRQVSRQIATLWTWIACRRAAGTCSLRRVAGREKSRTSSWARQKRAALMRLAELHQTHRARQRQRIG